MDKNPHGATGGDDQDAPFEDPEDAVGFGARRLLQRLPTKTYGTAGNQATGAWIKTKDCTIACSTRVGKDGTQPDTLHAMHMHVLFVALGVNGFEGVMEVLGAGRLSVGPLPLIPLCSVARQR
ncbi:hypothetical protein Esi_0401_0010 [Ectocarpus siliculosus]|uniref:Uncharacterized protein n=1 Tax=Ectocarpus siliculosus TaxID=2880 RepID=D8LMM4_ECTSI|nr:hypothetical protein Esi_0401_0010 [Ectocarpus siliculosus]|eukprot:CBN79721.1 hypothetical protein Esi_0401_0010 [Ectocarpus siliculosus]